MNKLISKNLKNKIKQIPGKEGFWKSYCESLFLNTAKTMKNKGFEENEIAELLKSIYWAVSEEYGY